MIARWAYPLHDTDFPQEVTALKIKQRRRKSQNSLRFLWKVPFAIRRTLNKGTHLLSSSFHQHSTVRGIAVYLRAIKAFTQVTSSPMGPSFSLNRLLWLLLTLAFHGFLNCQQIFDGLTGEVLWTSRHCIQAHCLLSVFSGVAIFMFHFSFLSSVHELTGTG